MHSRPPAFAAAAVAVYRRAADANGQFDLEVGAEIDATTSSLSCRGLVGLQLLEVGREGGTISIDLTLPK